jgi:diguanylate cyclase (GGDEF)-like protein
MQDVNAERWRQSGLFDLLALTLVGACFWLVGARFGLFARLTSYAIAHDAMDLVMLSCCMGLGVFVATVRKSVLLRRAIAGRLAAEALAEATARHDALTGLPNRRLFSETLEFALAARLPGDDVALMLIDLDRFKPVNDIHGHAAGNFVLCAVADRLLKIVPAGATVARLGGDEFAVVVPSIRAKDTLVGLAQQIIATIRDPISWSHSQLEVDGTIGVAIANPGESAPDALLHAADIAMYQGKREGRGRVCFFRAEMDAALKARAQTERELRKAVGRGEIEPYYQPIVALPGQSLVGFEVLARWNHPTRGLVAPEEFIPVAEEAGMISDLFYNLLRRACKDARTWPAYLQLAVNVSPCQFKDHQLPERILAILTETGFAPSRLEVEITESGLIADFDAARAALSSLQNLGVRIALDDFGTGYSSLYHLRELRFNKLKIDRSYVTTLQRDSEPAKLVDAIIQLGASLSLQTTAEGIENDVNLEWLSGQGCTYGQGFFFGRPMTRAAAEVFLRDEATKTPATNQGKERAA